MIRLTLGLMAAASLAACIEARPDPGSTEAGARLFAENCATCHGADARGNGPTAQLIGVEAPDLTLESQRNGGVFPRDRIRSIIDGLNRDPHFSAVMPEFGAMDLGETIIVEEEGLATPIPADLLALSNWIEAQQR